MPGLIDAHWHTILIRPTPEQAIYGDVGFTNLLAGAEARATLMRGFTSVRDLGGPSFGLKQAIDSGVVEGPRIWPSGAMITVTSGTATSACRPNSRATHRGRCRAWSRSAARWWRTRRTPCASACASS